MMTALRLRYLAYGLLGMPLAMSALPIYVQVPAYYTGHLGLSLASTGWVLFFARLIDTAEDPLLGHYIDRLDGKHLPMWMVAATVMLALAFWGIWLPPEWARLNTTALLAWLGAMLIIAYTAHSMLNIAYLSWGARLATQTDALLGAAAMRETAGLSGAVVAGVIPAMILTNNRAVDSQLGFYSMGFASLLMVALIALLFVAPPWAKVARGTANWRTTFGLMAANTGFRRLLLPFLLNAVSMAIPVTLALFFINDRLQLPQYAGVFMAIYFLASACGLPCWVAIAKRIGVFNAWRAGMVMAIVTFAGATLLGAGDFWAYSAVCLLAGFALGADLSLPPVLLATIIGKDDNTAMYYGVWTLLGKLSLALAGLSLPLLAFFGYQPGTPAGMSLAWMYAFVPCVFKLSAWLMLRRLPVLINTANVTKDNGYQETSS